MSYTDWQDIVEPTLKNKNELSILEFGLGDGTKYLLDNFKYVYSYELIDEKDYTLIDWYNQAEERFKSYSNWGSEVVMWQDIDFVDPGTEYTGIIPPELPNSLLSRINKLFSKYKFNAVLVDGGFHVRGDIANYILNNFPIEYVIIHDTNYNFYVDGYHRINLPENYETVKYTGGYGTYIFVKK